MSADYLVGVMFFRRAAYSLVGTIAKGVILGGLMLVGCVAFWYLLSWAVRY